MRMTTCLIRPESSGMSTRTETGLMSWPARYMAPLILFLTFSGRRSRRLDVSGPRGWRRYLPVGPLL